MSSENRVMSKGALFLLIALVVSAAAWAVGTMANREDRARDEALTDGAITVEGTVVAKYSEAPAAGGRQIVEVKFVPQGADGERQVMVSANDFIFNTLNAGYIVPVTYAPSNPQWVSLPGGIPKTTPSMVFDYMVMFSAVTGLTSVVGLIAVLFSGSDAIRAVAGARIRRRSRRYGAARGQDRRVTFGSR